MTCPPLQLLWWSRMMTEIATPTAPVLEVVDLEVDYAGSELVVLARGRRATDTSRFLWADPASNGFQSSLAGDVPAPTCSTRSGASIVSMVGVRLRGSIANRDAVQIQST